MNFEHISLFLYHLYSSVGSRLLFNIIIFLRASKRLPEFSGLMGKVYPGQLKPRHQIPEPRNRLIKKSDDYRFRGAGNNLHLIFVKPVDWTWVYVNNKVWWSFYLIVVYIMSIRSSNRLSAEAGHQWHIDHLTNFHKIKITHYLFIHARPLTGGWYLTTDGRSSHGSCQPRIWSWHWNYYFSKNDFYIR